MSKNYTIACDVDGTLINENGELDINVLPLFQKCDPSKTTFIFTTGGSEKSAKNALVEINKNLDTPIKAYISANCGSQIFSPEGKLIRNFTIKTTDIYKINKALQGIDPQSMIMYVSDSNYYIQNQDEAFYGRGLKNSLLLYIFKHKEHKKGQASGVTFLSCPSLDTFSKVQDFNKDNAINAIYVAPTCLKKDQKELLKNKLIFFANDYASYDGRLLTIFAKSKKQAIEEILSIEKNNPAYVNDIKEVIYLGDGTNDIELLKECNLSIARGENAKESAKKSAKLHLINLEQFATDLYEKGIFDEIIFPAHKDNKQNSKCVSVDISR